MELPAELEAAIVRAPDDRDGYAVAADWLQQVDSAQGELAALSLAPQTDAIADRIIELKRALLPPELRGRGPVSLEWRWGFVRGIALVSMRDAAEPALLRDLLASPIARFVQKLVVQQASPRVAEAIVEVVAQQRRALRCLRTLMMFLEEVPSYPLDLGRLSAAVPTVRRLVLRVAHTTGVLVLPQLQELAIDRNVEASRLIPASTLPRLEQLQVHADQLAVHRLDPRALPALRSVSLSHDGMDVVDVERWKTAEIASQLEQLDVYSVRTGRAASRLFVIDRKPRGAAGLVVMVGRAREPGTLVRIASSPFWIGRARSSGLQLDEDGIARRHAEICRGWSVANRVEAGCHVNGQFVEDLPLRNDDELAIGDHVFRFVEGDVDAEAARLRARYGLSDPRATPRA